MLGHKVTAAKSSDQGVTLTVEPAKGGEAEQIQADIVLLAIGRYAYTVGLNLADGKSIQRPLAPYRLQSTRGRPLSCTLINSPVGCLANTKSSPPTSASGR